MQSAFETRVVRHDKKGRTIIFQADLNRSNIIVPKTITWDQITLPEDWGLDRVVTPFNQRVIQEASKPIQNIKIDSIVEKPDGSVTIRFNRPPRISINDTQTSFSRLKKKKNL